MARSPSATERASWSAQRVSPARTPAGAARARWRMPPLRRCLAWHPSDAVTKSLGKCGASHGTIATQSVRARRKPLRTPIKGPAKRSPLTSAESSSTTVPERRIALDVAIGRDQQRPDLRCEALDDADDQRPTFIASPIPCRRRPCARRVHRRGSDRSRFSSHRAIRRCTTSRLSAFSRWLRCATPNSDRRARARCWPIAASSCESRQRQLAVASRSSARKSWPWWANRHR